MIILTLGMTEKHLSSHSALGFRNSSEADHRTETGQMMAMEITMWKQNSRVRVEEPQTQVRYELKENSSLVQQSKYWC